MSIQRISSCDVIFHFQFYFMMLLVYVVLGGLWGWLCYKHVRELLPIQVRRVQCIYPLIYWSHLIEVLSIRSDWLISYRNGSQLGFVLLLMRRILFIFLQAITDTSMLMASQQLQPCFWSLVCFLSLRCFILNLFQSQYSMPAVIPCPFSCSLLFLLGSASSMSR